MRLLAPVDWTRMLQSSQMAIVSFFLLSCLSHHLSLLQLLATKVGSSGISLSGGQKQRLALARAVYACRNIIILDDILSGLDADTEEHVFKSLFAGKGLFRRLGTTVLLSTHAVYRLSYGDHVVAMKRDGSIAEQGTLEELKASAGYLTLLRAQYKDLASDEISPQEHKAMNVALDKETKLTLWKET